jgi:predicted Abi (CAAX) family protease
VRDEQGMAMDRITEYLRCNLVLGFRKSPMNGRAVAYLLVPFYFAAAMVIGFWSDLFAVGLLDSSFIYVLPVCLFVFPSLLEEAFFRGVLIPIAAGEKPLPQVLFYILLSTACFVLWHPLNALTINPTAVSFFLNPFFLLIVALLGVTCSVAYIYSRSIWLPVIVHWATVVVWVIFLGGRNKILEIGYVAKVNMPAGEVVW